MKGKKNIKMAKAIRKYARRSPNCDDGDVYAESTSITVEAPDDCSVIIKCRGHEI